MASERDKAQVIIIIGKLFKVRNDSESIEVRHAMEAAIEKIITLMEEDDT
jgi:hypothetical protein